MENTFRIIQASLKIEDGTLLKIIAPKVKQKKGLMFVSGRLEADEYSGIKDVEKKLGMVETTTKLPSTSSIIGLGGHGETIEINRVYCTNLQYTGLKAKFSCYGSLKYGIPFHSLTEFKDNMYSIIIEGLTLEYNQRTTLEKRRTIQSKEERIALSSNFDYIETSLNFHFQNKNYNLNISFEEDKLEKIRMTFLDKEGFDLDTYKKIKFEMRSFLSFASGTQIVFREENYSEANVTKREVYSTLEAKRREGFIYIPINSIHFRSKQILQDYLNTFDTFLIIDKHLSLSEIFFLLTQAKRVNIESSFFILLIALEKLADRFIKSPFNLKRDEHIIEAKTFETLIQNTKETFKKDFQKVSTTQFNNLYSRLGSINKKGKTNSKFDKLLEFAEINKTEETNLLLTTLRNAAIHEGDINIPEGNAFENRNALELLLNNIIANIIQYKGIRYIKFENGKFLCEQKLTYKFDYTGYRNI